MVDQASDAGNPNDFSRRCRHIARSKHRTIIDALMAGIVRPTTPRGSKHRTIIDALMGRS